MASIERLQGRQSQRNVELCNSSAPQKRLPIKISTPVLCRRKAHKESKRTFWIATLILSSIIRRSRSEVVTEWLTDVSETWICNTTIYTFLPKSWISWTPPNDFNPLLDNWGLFTTRSGRFCFCFLFLFLFLGTVVFTTRSGRSAAAEMEKWKKQRTIIVKRSFEDGFVRGGISFFLGHLVIF